MVGDHSNRLRAIDTAILEGGVEVPRLTQHRYSVTLLGTSKRLSKRPPMEMKAFGALLRPRM